MKFIMIISLVFVLACFSPGDNGETITIAADEWCPYSCDPASARPGYMVEVAKLVFEKAGYQVKYTVMDWSRAVKKAKKGEIEGIIGATRSEVPHFIFPINELGFSPLSFFVKKGNPWQFDGLESLQEVSVGIAEGYDYGQPFDAYFQEYSGTSRVQSVSGEDAVRINIEKLLSRLVDVIPEDRSVFLYTAKKMGVLDKIGDAGSETVTDENWNDMLVNIAFSPKNPKSMRYAQILSEGIWQLRESGELDMILARYGLQDWK